MKRNPEMFTRIEKDGGYFPEFVSGEDISRDTIISHEGGEAVFFQVGGIVAKSGVSEGLFIVTVKVRWKQNGKNE